MAHQNLTAETFDELLRAADKPILLDFWAPWCGPCQQLAPVLEQLSRQRQDILVAKVNIDQEMELAKRFRIVSIPTLVVLRNGEITAKAVGCRSLEEILNLLEQ